MSEAIWIIEDLGGNTGLAELAGAAMNLGANVKLMTPLAFKEFNPLKERGEIFFNGSINGAIRLKKLLKHGTRDRIFLTPENYKYFNYANAARHVMLNYPYRFTRFEHLEGDRLWEAFEKYGYEAKIFLKPNSGLKEFSGHFVDLQDLRQNIASGKKAFQDYEEFFNETIIISKPKELTGEWRFVCWRSEILSVSSYRYQGLDTFVGGAPDVAYDVCSDFLRSINYPDDFFTVDVCSVVGEGYKVVEMNAFSTSGFYACDPVPIAKKVMEEMKKCW